MPAIPARVIATCFALISFTSTIVVGVAANNAASHILLWAIGVMIVCWVVGRLVGGVAQHAIDQHVQRFKAQNPLTGDPDSTSTTGQASSRQDAAVSV